MKRTFKKIIPCLALSLTLCLPVAETGCKTANQAAFGATTITVDSVNASIPIWNAYVRSGKATANDKARVASAFNAYQNALKTERDAVVSYYNNPDGTTDFQAFQNATAAAELNFITTVKSIIH